MRARLDVVHKRVGPSACIAVKHRDAMPPPQLARYAPVLQILHPCEIGLRPQLIGCKVCYAYENEDFFFLINQSYVLCEYHFEENGLDENDYNIRITPSQFAALQFICFTDMERLFNFRVSPESQAKLNEVTEKYILANMSRSFRSLEYYKTLLP